MPTDLHVESFALGDWMTNCYVIHPPVIDDAHRPCWIIDAGYGPEPLIGYVRSRGLHPESIVLTHAHLDHIGGLAAVRAAWPDVPILIHEAETAFLTDPDLNLSSAVGDPLVAPRASRVLRHGDALKLGELRFEVHHTPGHSPGGVSLHHPGSNVVFVGDTLFAGSVGRSDFPTSDPAALLRGIRDELLTLPDETAVYPGHGPPTTIGRERATNPYL